MHHRPDLIADAAPIGPVTASMLRELVRERGPLREVSDAALDTLARAAERIFVPAGTRILPRGSVAGAAFIVEHGRVRCDWGLDRPMLGELGRGDVFGLGSVLSERPMSGDVFALRDARLVRLPAADLLQALALHPDLLRAYARWHDEAALRSHGIGEAPSLPNAFAVLPMDADPVLMSAARTLCEAFGRVAGSAVLVDWARARDVLGPDAASRADFEHPPVALLDWCEAQEHAGASLFFACDATDTAWTRWCLRQTDKVVVIARADDDVDLDALDHRFHGLVIAGAPVQVSLVLVHGTATTVPHATRRWLELRCLRAHHHVRIGEVGDFLRAARRLGERATGVVLGGGGARGFAHIGVLRALEEAGFPVDHVGGTSMGSVIAAAYARGWAPQQILEIVAGVFARSRAVFDLDIPIVAMLAGRKLDRVLRHLFEDLDIGDLWRPFYAVSSDLSEARMRVHDRGPVWRALRASASLPGVFPPVRSGQALLVDGGLFNNVPMDVMTTRCGEGPVVAIDVGGGAELKLEAGENVPTGWSLLRNRLNPFSGSVSAPSIAQIIVGSTTVSSKRYLDHLLEVSRVELFLRPPVQAFNLLGFDAYQRLHDVGYESAREALTRHGTIAVAGVAGVHPR